MQILSSTVSAKLVVRLRKAAGMTIAEARNYLLAIPVTEREIIVALAEQFGDGYIHDPIETNPAFLAVIEEVKQIAQKEYELRKKQLEEKSTKELAIIEYRLIPKVHTIMKRILKENHGIEWKSIAEMNPHITFD